jgi:hypothetical protein
MPISHVTDSPQQPFWFRSKIFAPDCLVQDDRDVISETVMITGAAPLQRGSVLGQLDDGRYTLATATAIDGSANPRAILAADTDPSMGDLACGVYLAGCFNVQCLIFGDGITPAVAAIQLRPLSIFLVGIPPA